MDFSDYRNNVLNNAHKNYPQYIIESKEKNPVYLGCGFCNTKTHAYLALICTVPIFNRLSEAKEQIIENLAWSHEFENYKLKKELTSADKIIHFFAAHQKKISSKAQSFIFKPAQLVKIFVILKDTFPQKTQKEMMIDLFQNEHSQVRKKLFKLTEEHLNHEKDLIVDDNWKKAKESFKHGHLLKFIQQIWGNFLIKHDTKQFVTRLRELEKTFHLEPKHQERFANVHLGDNFCEFDKVGAGCQLDDK